MFPQRSVIICTFFLACVFSTGAQNADAPNKKTDENFAQILVKIQTQLNASQRALKFPGATVGFILPEGHSGAVSTGVADIDAKTPLKPTDRMLAGSIGKTFVAAEALLLAQEGKLQLDEKIERWLGNEKWFEQLPNAREVTLRMLLNHSSGIPDHTNNQKLIKAFFKNSAKDIRYEELIAYILDKKPLFAAGKGYAYTDTNYILAGMIIEKVSSKAMYDEITRRFLQPLQLNGTIPANHRVLPEMANGYFENKPVIVGGGFILNPQWEWAGGGFASTAEDLARWAKALYEGKALEPKLLNEMLHSTTIGDGAHYGLGVEIEQTKFGNTYGHSGTFPGYLSIMRYFPAYKIAIAAQVNADESKETSQFINTIIDDVASVIISTMGLRSLSTIDKIALQTLAQDWLGLLEKGHFTESWEGISAELKARYTKETWQAALQPALKQTGIIKNRTLKSITYTDPQNDTVAVEFTSSFARKSSMLETIILRREVDGKWQVASYTMK